MNKKNIWFWFISIIIVIIIASFIMVKQVKQMQIEPLNPEDFSINGVKPKEVVSEKIFQKLGTPKKTKEKNAEEGIFKYYIYSSFTIVTQFYNDGIERIEEFQITNSSFRTNRGISIGDDINKLFEKYGPEKLEDNCYYYEYLPKLNSERKYIMVIEVDNMKIKNIWFQ